MDKPNKIMKKGFINIFILVLAAVVSAVTFSFLNIANDKINENKKQTVHLSAANTELTDTLNTFRVNYNNLNAQMVNATSVDPGHIHSINKATGTITTFTSTSSTITNAIITNATTTTLFGTSSTFANGSTTFFNFVSATGTTLTIGGVASTSQLITGSSTAVGSSTFLGPVIFGFNGATVQCPTMYIRGTSTLFYITLNTSTYALSGTSTKPSNLCN